MENVNKYKILVSEFVTIQWYKISNYEFMYIYFSQMTNVIGVLVAFLIRTIASFFEHFLYL